MISNNIKGRQNFKPYMTIKRKNTLTKSYFE